MLISKKIGEIQLLNLTAILHNPSATCTVRGNNNQTIYLPPWVEQNAKKCCQKHEIANNMPENHRQHQHRHQGMRLSTPLMALMLGTALEPSTASSRG
jgi:hypothetical protein